MCVGGASGEGLGSAAAGCNLSPSALTQSSSARSPPRPCFPTDTCKILGSFSSRPETQGGDAQQEHNEKVLLSLEEVKVSAAHPSVHRRHHELY